VEFTKTGQFVGEFAKTGQFVSEYNVHQNQGGAFGIATSISQNANRLAVVNDNSNNIAVTTFDMP